MERRREGKGCQELGPEKIVAIGTGPTSGHAQGGGSSIAVVGDEGCSTTLLKEADLVVTDIMKAFGLITHPQRILATLRD